MSKYFSTLNKINVNSFTEKKGQFTYLSWSWAVRELLKVDPEATWETHEWGIEGNKQPYMQTEAGCFVQVTVWVGGIARSQVHPVLDNRNKPLEKPNAFQINTSIQRCLAKAIALHGLGLYLFAGEDLPQVDPLNKEQLKQINNLIDSLENKTKQEELREKVESNVINVTNYNGAVSKITRLIDEQSS